MPRIDKGDKGEAYVYEQMRKGENFADAVTRSQNLNKGALREKHFIELKEQKKKLKEMKDVNFKCPKCKKEDRIVVQSTMIDDEKNHDKVVIHRAMCQNCGHGKGWTWDITKKIK